MVAKTERGKHCEQEIISRYLEVKADFDKLFKFKEVTKDLRIGRIYEEVSELTGYSTHRIGIIVRQFIAGKIKIERP